MIVYSVFIYCTVKTHLPQELTGVFMNIFSKIFHERSLIIIFSHRLSEIWGTWYNGGNGLGAPLSAAAGGRMPWHPALNLWPSGRPGWARLRQAPTTLGSRDHHGDPGITARRPFDETRCPPSSDPDAVGAAGLGSPAASPYAVGSGDHCGDPGIPARQPFDEPRCPPPSDPDAVGARQRHALPWPPVFLYFQEPALRVPSNCKAALPLFPIHRGCPASPQRRSCH